MIERSEASDGHNVPWRGSQGRALLVISVLAAVLMLIAAANIVLVFVLISANRTDSSNFLPYVAIGVLPFIATAAFLAWTVAGRGAATRSGRTPQQIVIRLLAISAIGLPLMVVCGFWAALFAAAQVLRVGSPEADALYVFQFTFVAAVVADGVTMVVALVTRGGGSLARKSDINR
jgi:hypothetical protein